MTFATAFVEGTNPDPRCLATGRIASLQQLAAGAFAREVENDLAGGRNLLVFLHGFANGFSDALTRAAFNRDWFAASQVPEADCTVLAFSWPSRGRIVDPAMIPAGLALAPMTFLLKVALGQIVSPLASAYREDQRAAAASADDLMSVLDRARPAMDMVRARGGRVFLLAHSMGNLVLQSALDLWEARGFAQPRLFDEAFVVAADTGWAEKNGAGPAWLHILARLSGRVHVLHSRADGILELSGAVNGLQRLGLAGPKDMLAPARYPSAAFRFLDCAPFPDNGPGKQPDSAHQFYRRVPEVRNRIARAMAGEG